MFKNSVFIVSSDTKDKMKANKLSDTEWNKIIKQLNLLSNCSKRIADKSEK